MDQRLAIAGDLQTDRRRFVFQLETLLAGVGELIKATTAQVH